MSDDDDKVRRFPARVQRIRYEKSAITIPQRAWIMRGLLLRGHLTAVLAPGGVGKSNFGLAVAQHLAAGQHFGSFKCVGGAKTVALFSVEEDPDEIRRRMFAIREWFDLPMGSGHNLIVVSAEDSLLVTIDKQGVAKMTAVGEAVERLLSRISIDVMVIDPFIEVWAGDENSNTHVRAAAAQIRGMCRRMNCAGLIMHHVRKGGFAPGDMDVARGASSFAGLVRLAYTMSKMSKDEAAQFNIERPQHVRVDHAKGNYMPPSEYADWYRFQDIELDNATDEQPVGDHVGVLVPWDPPKALDGISYMTIDRILDQVEEGSEGEHYSFDSKTKERWVGSIIIDEAGVNWVQAKSIVSTWRQSGLLYELEYQSPTTKRRRKGVFVEPSQRPSPEAI